MCPYGRVSVCFSHFCGIGVRVGFGSRPQTETEGSTNTENTPYGMFSMLEGEQQGLGIVEHEHTPVWHIFRARGAKLGRALARRKKEEKSGHTLYTCTPIAFPTLSVAASVVSCCLVFFASAAMVVVLEGRGTSVVMVEVEVTSWWGLDVLCDTIQQSLGIVDVH